MIYLTLFWEFCKIGLFAIGGGMATIPFLMELPAKYNWFSASELADMIAISQSCPGPVGVNLAVFAGYKAAGIGGAVTASVALVFPAIITIIIIAKFLANFSENKTVKAVFYGIRPAVAALIGYAVFELCRISLMIQDPQGQRISIVAVVLCLGSFGLMQWKKLAELHPLIWIVAGAAAGIVLKL